MPNNHENLGLYFGDHNNFEGIIIASLYPFIKLYFFLFLKKGVRRELKLIQFFFFSHTTHIDCVLLEALFFKSCM